MQAIYGSHGDCPASSLRRRTSRIASTPRSRPVNWRGSIPAPSFVLTDMALASRIEAFEQPDLSRYVHEPVLDLAPRGEEFKPYPLDGSPATRLPARHDGGHYPVVTGLEHDEWGHPSANPGIHQKMTERASRENQGLRRDLPLPEIHGDEAGEILARGLGLDLGSDPRGGRSPSRARPQGGVHPPAPPTRCPTAWNRSSRTTPTSSSWR